MASNDSRGNVASRMCPTNTFAPVFASAIFAHSVDISMPCSFHPSPFNDSRNDPELQPRSKSAPDRLCGVIAALRSRQRCGAFWPLAEISLS